MHIDFFIPVWVFWVLGVPLVLILLFLAWLGALFLHWMANFRLF